MLDCITHYQTHPDTPMYIVITYITHKQGVKDMITSISVRTRQLCKYNYIIMKTIM